MDDGGADAVTSARIEQLEAALAESRAEVRELRLQLDVLSTTDPVTGMPNAHGIVDNIGVTVERQSRTGEPFALMLVSIPLLAGLSARLGGAAAAEAMRHSSALVGAALRGMDIVGRLDATSFVAVLPQLESDGVAAVIDRLRSVLGAVPLDLGSDRIDLDPVIGVVLSAPGAPTAPEALIEQLQAAAGAAAAGRPIIRAAITDSAPA